jgi:hypothetical protein
VAKLKQGADAIKFSRPGEATIALVALRMATFGPIFDL